MSAIVTGLLRGKVATVTDCLSVRLVSQTLTVETVSSLPVTPLSRFVASFFNMTLIHIFLHNFIVYLLYADRDKKL